MLLSQAECVSVDNNCVWWIPKNTTRNRHHSVKPNCRQSANIHSDIYGELWGHRGKVWLIMGFSTGMVTKGMVTKGKVWLIMGFSGMVNTTDRPTLSFN